ncbi:MAG: efflux RND transporter periplasmic adaptor subunit [Lachnospiraceae bacterium]|nr:efflux RND transporter periplasmic adaptor subunit [Lachnospiraceae bacterium]
MKKVIITLLILALLGGGGYGAYYYFFLDSAGSQGRVSSTSDDAVYVMTVSAITGYGTGSGVTETYAGEVEAQATIEVKLDSDRTLDECYVEEGDIVEEGQELFSYETQDVEDDIAQAEIDIERDQMEIESNEAQITQNEKLMASATDSDEKTEYYLEILQLQNSNKSLEYEIKSKQLEIESLQETLDESVVTAEMGGIIQKISDVSDDDSYSSSDSAYITILAEGDYRIKGTVNELNYDDIYEGMPVIVHSRVDSSIIWTGTITEISTEQDGSDSDDYYYGYYESSDTSTYSFYVELDNADGLLLGQHVYLEEDSGQLEEKTGLWLSEYYIMLEDDTAYVWLANTSNTIEKHEITLGDYDEDLEEYEILDGLEAEDYIAPLADTISEGDPVYYYDIAAVTTDDYDDLEYYDADEEDDDGTIYYDVDDEEYYDLEDDSVYYYDEDDDDIVYYEDDDDVYYEDDDDDVYYEDDDDIIYYEED